MDETPFYGRQEELERLDFLRGKKTSSLVVIKGRRRIGKSRLISEFSKKMKTYTFIGLPPDEKTTEKTQREYFVQQMERLFGLKGIKSDDWGDILWNLGKEIQKGTMLIVFDEINWIGSLDHTFLGKLKSAWDLYFKGNPKLIMILSGSMSSWIEKNILSSTGFMGRTSLELSIDELPLQICNLFWRGKADMISSYDKFKILSVTGGIPRYLEEIDPNRSAEDNILNLAFKKGGLLVEEFDRIFSDLFSKRSHLYKQIVERLVNGSATLDQICETLQLEKGGTMSEYLENLVETGYVAKDNTWNIKDNIESNLCKFRLKDNYLRFYLKYIEPQRIQIEKNRIKTPPAWTTIMGIQFENLVLNNFHKVYELLHIDPKDVIYDNPFFQRPTKSHPGCQVDYLIQMKYQSLYVVEIKFSKEPIGMSVVKEMEEKCKRIVKPKSFSLRPILIHVNGVTDALIESDYFSHVIDFGQFLN